jgi:hypothetical protein
MFVFYLKRHIEVDGESHGPMAQQIIDRAVGNDAGRKQQVMEAAVEAGARPPRPVGRRAGDAGRNSRRRRDRTHRGKENGALSAPFFYA